MIAEGYESVMKNVAAAAAKRNLTVKDIVVIAATKTQSSTLLNEFKKNGLVFGENRVQELVEKYPLVKGIDWHFIGQLQTNKVKYIIDKVSLIHSVDRLSLATEINDRARKISKVQDVLLEINLGGEESKGGVSVDKLFELIDGVISLDNIAIKGLMTVMPLCKTNFDGYERMAELFEKCKKTYSSIDWKYLSMGMSDDYVQAIEKGSNMVRIGRAFFGDRLMGNK